MSGLSPSIAAPGARAPAYVSAAMIRDYEIFYLAGSDKDTFSYLRTIHGDSDVFYNLRADPIICPQGAWFVTSFKLMSEVFQDPAKFSNHEIVKYSQLVGENWSMIPVEFINPRIMARSVINILRRPQEASVRLVELGGR